MCYVRIGTSWGKKKKSIRAHKTGSWYLLGVLFKIFHELPPAQVTSESILRYFTVFLAPGGGEKEDIFVIV